MSCVFRDIHSEGAAIVSGIVCRLGLWSAHASLLARLVRGLPNLGMLSQRLLHPPYGTSSYPAPLCLLKGLLTSSTNTNCLITGTSRLSTAAMYINVCGIELMPGCKIGVYSATTVDRVTTAAETDVCRWVYREMASRRENQFGGIFLNGILGPLFREKRGIGLSGVQVRDDDS